MIYYNVRVRDDDGNYTARYRRVDMLNSSGSLGCWAVGNDSPVIDTVYGPTGWLSYTRVEEPNDDR